ncbi:MAG: hypothetical protein DELT_01263 [Desulfovibrio sp.]
MNRLSLLALSFFAFFVLGGCGPKGPDITQFGLPDAAIARDLEILPQDIFVYAEKAGNRTKLLPPEEQAAQDARFDANFFAPWNENMTYLPEDMAFEAVKNLSPQKGYAENLRPWDTDRWQELIRNCGREQYRAFPVTPAITVDTVHVRRLPTEAPYFLDPAKAGEGFPFDYLQNSTLAIGTPVSIMHVSTDSRWALVQTRLFSGWVKAELLAATDRKFIAAWKARPLAAVVSERAALYVNPGKKDAVSGSLVREAHIGAVLPFAAESRETPPQKAPVVYLNVPVRGAEGKAVMGIALAGMYDVRKKPVPLTVENVARVGNAMMGQPYGWGGMFGQRDCSAMMRDLFTPFGIWLPRNSRQQGTSGWRVLLDGLSPDAKDARVMEKGVPFFSLVSMPGHVGLYLGSYILDGKETPVMLHNIWGLRTVSGSGQNQKSGRAIIGKAVITSLRPGAEHSVISSPASLLDRIGGIVILPPGQK